MTRHFLIWCALALWGVAAAAQAQTRGYAPRGRAMPISDALEAPAGAIARSHDGGAYDGDAYHDGAYDGGPAGCKSCGAAWGDDFCGLGGSCGVASRFWARSELLVWWVRGANTPPLVTTSPAGTLQPAAGVLPAAQVLFGNERVDGDGRVGGRQSLGYWFDDCGSFGLEANYFGLETVGTDFLVSGNGAPIIGRPFVNVATLPLPQNDASLQSFPNIISGSVGVTTESDVLGAELNLRKAIHCDQCMRVEFLGGYRFFRLDESLYVTENTTSTDPNGQIPLGTMIDIHDRFGTQNEFHGGNLGMLMRFQDDCWALSVAGKLGIGDMRQQVSIAGNTAVTVPGVPTVTSDGGFLALSSNSGVHTRDRISFLPELALNLQYQINCTWRANIGYTLLYVTRVLRPGDQIDLNINPNLFPPPVVGALPNQPALLFAESDVWLQGLNFGVEAKF